MGRAMVLAALAGLLVCGCKAAPKEEAPAQPPQQSAVDDERLNELIGRLKDNAASTRQSAAIELGEIGDQRAVPALIEALGDENIMSPAAVAWEMVLANYRATIAGALSKITGENFGSDHAKWKEWYDKNRGR
jgi:HEAT repeat protein